MISVLDSFDTAIVRKAAMTECDQQLFRFISDSITPYYPMVLSGYAQRCLAITPTAFCLFLNCRMGWLTDSQF